MKLYMSRYLVLHVENMMYSLMLKALEGYFSRLEIRSH